MIKITTTLALATVGFFLQSGGAKAAGEQDVLAFTCDDCSFTEARDMVRIKAFPSFECVANDGSNIITIGNQECHSDPVYSAVYNETSGTLWGFKLSHTNQGTYPPLMQLQIEQYTHSQTVQDMVREGVEFTNELSSEMSSIASNLSETFSTSTDFNAWLSGSNISSAASMNNVLSTTGDGSLTCEESGEYQAVKAATSGEFRNELYNRVATEYGNFDGSPNEFFEEVEFNGFGLGLQKLGFNVSLSWDNIVVDKTLYFKFEGPDPLATPDNQQNSQVAFTLSPNGSLIEISLDPTKTHISGNYWAVMTDPSVGTVEVSPCAEVALEEVYGEGKSEPTGTTGGGGYNSLPGSGGTGGGLGSGTGGDGWDHQLCDKHFYDRNGYLLITVKTQC